MSQHGEWERMWDLTHHPQGWGKNVEFNPPSIGVGFNPAATATATATVTAQHQQQQQQQQQRNISLKGLLPALKGSYGLLRTLTISSRLLQALKDSYKLLKPSLLLLFFLSFQM